MNDSFRSAPLLSMLALLAVSPAPSFAADPGKASDPITIIDPYVRQAPPGAMATGAFMVIRNQGDKPVKLIKADNPASKVTELHTHINDGGMMKMRQVPDIEIKAKGEALLQPGGLHVMLIDLKAPLAEGTTVPISLTFDDGKTRKVEATVKKPMGAVGMPMGDGGMKKH